ncbi:MAG: hypothetical protein ACR2KV_06225, partial [Solirubrobacteraceae bacterium]
MGGPRTIAVLLLALAVLAPPQIAMASAGSPGPGRRVVVAFLAAPGGTSAVRVLAGDRRVEALGLIDLTEGDYNEPQALLNLTQGAWVSQPVYHPKAPPPITVGADGRIPGWPRVLARAAGAPAEIQPGLLAGSIPGGAAYAGTGARPRPEAAVAADRLG